MDALVALKVENEELATEIELIPAANFIEDDEIKKEILSGIYEVNNQIELLQNKINDLNSDIDRWTNDADNVDYITAVTCGVLSGIWDSFKVGEWNFKEAKGKSNEFFNKKVTDFVLNHPRYQEFLKRRKKNKRPDAMENVLAFLEEEYPIPGDNAFTNIDYDSIGYDGLKVTPTTHHLDDFCHHPTIIGLLASICVQFTGSATFHPAGGMAFSVPVTINEDGLFYGCNTWSKLFCGVVNWVFNVAKQIAKGNIEITSFSEQVKNVVKKFTKIKSDWEGHLMSDIAGNALQAKNKGEGMGIPGTFLSYAKLLSTLPIIKDSDFGKNLYKAYTGGIGNKNRQLDLGIFNHLFEGASSKFDARTEYAVMLELKRQSLPIKVNEVLVRAFYFIKRFIEEVREKRDLMEIDWKKLLPIGNRTISRMVTVSLGTFVAFDLADAAIRAALKTKKINTPDFWSVFILRVNFVGIGRFALACVTDAGMGLYRENDIYKRIFINNRLLHLLNANVYYKHAETWLAAKDTIESIKSTAGLLIMTYCCYLKSMKVIKDDIREISKYRNGLETYNPNLSDSLLDILKY